MDNEILKDTQELFDKCNVIELLNKVADNIIYELAPNININISFDNFENIYKQHKFSLEGKFHFLTALQLNYNSQDLLKNLNYFIKEFRGIYYKGIIKEECFEKIVKQILVWFEDEFMINKFVKNLFNTELGNKKIKNEDIIFMLLEYCYKSPALSEVYSFDKLDIRRQVLYRLEYITYSMFQQTKNFVKNIDNEIVERLKFNYTIEKCIEYIRFKEVEIRRDFINELFFIIEHFLSTIRKYYKIRENDDVDKKDLLKVIFNYFGIKIDLDLEEIKNNINSRCSETNSEVLDIINGRNIKKDFIFYHNLFIQIRNSLHSNGKVSKNTQKFKLGKIGFNFMRKDMFHNNMSIVHIIILSLIEIMSIEKIIDKTIRDVFIKDEYMIELDKFVKQKN